jgi:hypothetical protein
MTTEKVKYLLNEHGLSWDDFVHWFNNEEDRYIVGIWDGRTLWEAKDIEDFINTSQRQ